MTNFKEKKEKMSLPNFLLPSAKEGSNFKSVFEIITASSISIKGI